MAERALKQRLPMIGWLRGTAADYLGGRRRTALRAAAATTVALTLALGCSKYGPTRHFDPQARSAYIAETIQSLRTFRPGDREDEFYLREDIRGLSFSSGNRAAFIRFGVDEWVFMIYHDIHREQPGEFLVGDMTLAIDHRGEIWMNEDHGCGGPRMPAKTGPPIGSVDAYFTMPMGFSTWVKLAP